MRNGRKEYFGDIHNEPVVSGNYIIKFRRMLQILQRGREHIKTFAIKDMETPQKTAVVT